MAVARPDTPRSQQRIVLLAVLLGVAGVSFIARVALESAEGFRAEYAADRPWGRDVRQRIDRQISTSVFERVWKDAQPDRFRARWSGLLSIGRSGWFTFATTSSGVSTVTIDGLRVVTNEGGHPPQSGSGRVRLLRGFHQVEIEYAQSGGTAAIAWLWARDAGPLSSVPSWAVWTEAVGSRRALAARLVAPIPFAAMMAAALLGLWMVWRRTGGGVVTVRPDWALLFILVFGAYFRLQYVTLPMAEAHNWRQITNADIARNFSERSLNLLYPEVSWGGGGQAYVGMEFPLLQWLAAALFRGFGESDLVCRGVAIAFSLATVVALFGLGRCLWGRAVGRGAAFFYAASPSAIFFGRTFISDTPMVCFSAFGVWGFASYLRTGRRAALVGGVVTAALACMVKVPAVIIFAPIVYLAWEQKRWALRRDRALLAGLVTVALLTVAWYVHADVLFHRTGLGQAIWHASGGYLPDIMAVAGPAKPVSHWATIGQLRDPAFYATLAERLWRLHFTPVGTLLVLFGAIAVRAVPNRRTIDVWFATVVLFILVSADGNLRHEFHQLPILLPAALYFGLAVQRAFDLDWLRRQAPFGLGLIASALVFGAAGWIGFRDSRVVRDMFRPTVLDMRPMIVGTELQHSTPPSSLMVTVEYSHYGGNSPVLLYRARRRGWSFDVDGITPQVLERLRAAYGASYFVTLVWSELKDRRPEVVAFLETQERMPVNGNDVALFKLR